jgi:hypothetical protein
LVDGYQIGDFTNLQGSQEGTLLAPNSSTVLTSAGPLDTSGEDLQGSPAWIDASYFVLAAPRERR